jgi:hypothetical protein
MNEDSALLHYARVVGAFVIVGLLIFDRLGPILSPEYEPFGDTSLGLMLGALFALVGIQGIDYLKGRS